MDLFCILDGGGDASSDRPHRLIGDHETGKVFSRDPSQPGRDLAGRDLLGALCGSLLGGLPAALNHVQPRFQRMSNFFGNQLVGFVKAVASL